MNEEVEKPVTRRDLAEGKIERVMTDKTALVPMSDKMGGLQFDNAMQMAEAAKLMSTAGPMLPPWLQGNVGGCWAIILRAVELGVSPLTLAAQSYLVNNKGVEQVAFMSNFYHSIIEARAPIKERLKPRYVGQGDDRVCFVYATFKGETEPREWPPADSADQFSLKNLRPPLNEYGKRKGSPLWDTKPDLQMFYAMSRDWARVYCPDIIAGVYAKDDFVDDDEVKTVQDTRTAVNLRSRLRGSSGEGFAADHVAKTIEASLAAATTVDVGRNSAVPPKSSPPDSAGPPAQSAVAAASATADTGGAT